LAARYGAVRPGHSDWSRPKRVQRLFGHPGNDLPCDSARSPIRVSHNKTSSPRYGSDHRVRIERAKCPEIDHLGKDTGYFENLGRLERLRNHGAGRHNGDVAPTAHYGRTTDGRREVFGRHVCLILMKPPVLDVNNRVSVLNSRE